MYCRKTLIDRRSCFTENAVVSPSALSPKPHPTSLMEKRIRRDVVQCIALALPPSLTS